MFTTAPGCRITVVMRVSGGGKSTVTGALATPVGARYLDADEFHPTRNVAKISSEVPLTDEDRLPWLDRIRRELDAVTGSGENMVLSLLGTETAKARAAPSSLVRQPHLDDLAW